MDIYFLYYRTREFMVVQRMDREPSMVAVDLWYSESQLVPPSVE